MLFGDAEDRTSETMVDHGVFTQPYSTNDTLQENGDIFWVCQEIREFAMLRIASLIFRFDIYIYI